MADATMDGIYGELLLRLAEWSRADGTTLAQPGEQRMPTRRRSGGCCAPPGRTRFAGDGGDRAAARPKNRARGGQALERLQRSDGRLSIAPPHPGDYWPTRGRARLDGARRLRSARQRALDFLEAHRGHHWPRPPASRSATTPSWSAGPGWRAPAPGSSRPRSPCSPSKPAAAAAGSAPPRAGACCSTVRSPVAAGTTATPRRSGASCGGPGEHRPRPGGAGATRRRHRPSPRASPTSSASSPGLTTPLALAWAILALSAWAAAGHRRGPADPPDAGARAALGQLRHGRARAARVAATAPRRAPRGARRRRQGRALAGHPPAVTRRELVAAGATGGGAAGRLPRAIRAPGSAWRAPTTYATTSSPCCARRSPSSASGAPRSQGKRILLKPNLVETASRRRHINTHPEVVRATAGRSRARRRRGPGRRGPRPPPRHPPGARGVGPRRRAGEREAALPRPQSPARLRGRQRRPAFGLTAARRCRGCSPRSTGSCRSPRSKTHHWTGVTLSMKNLFGLMPGSFYGWPKNVLHYAGLQEAILDIDATVRPQLAIVDGIVGMEGDGPIMGDARSRRGCSSSERICRRSTPPRRG